MKELRIKALQIDLARQKENIPYIFSYIDLASNNGYNVVVLYLENAVRTKSTTFFKVDETYSQEEILQIVEYAEKKGIEIIPALETLDHLEKFMEYSELENIGEEDYVTIGRGFNDKPTCGCLSNERFYKFIDTYVVEVASLFKGQYLHVGLDETFDFTACGKCQERLKNGEKAIDMFYEHVMHMYNVCKSLGKRMMMWDDYFEYFDIVEKLPRDIIMCNWNYSFMSGQPLGHWTNRISRNWFAYYDKLGFEYMFCTNVHRTSSTYAMDSFYDYAEQYNPIGALMTAWERSSCFYLGAYPCIKYWGKLISGQISRAQKVDVYAEVLGGDYELAELFANVHVAGCGGYGDITKVCEGGYTIKRIYGDGLRLAQDKIHARIELMEEGEAKEIATDMYNYLVEQNATLIMQECALDYFEGRDRSKILCEITKIKEEYAKIKQFGLAMWEKYREGIKSSYNDF
jgi:hypothetical protein